jgi:large subunit ribosomal protein L6
MSRIGKKPIPVPPGVKVALEGATVKAEGPKGKLSQSIPSGVSVTMDSNVLTVARDSDHERKLEIVGIGYRCQIQGKALQLALGYSHPVIFPLPDGIQAEVDRQVSITLRGADKALLGQTAAKLRALRKPDPYKGKGIKYADEHIRRKVGKKAGAK